MGLGEVATITYLPHEVLYLYALDAASQFLAFTRWQHWSASTIWKRWPQTIIFITGCAFQCLLSDDEIFWYCAEISKLTLETSNHGVRLLSVMFDWKVVSGCNIPICEKVRVWHELFQLQGERMTFIQHQEFQGSGVVICCFSTFAIIGVKFALWIWEGCGF